jgi:hypothetical protein
MTQQSARSGYTFPNGTPERSTADRVSEIGSEALDRGR